MTRYEWLLEQLNEDEAQKLQEEASHYKTRLRWTLDQELLKDEEPSISDLIATGFLWTDSLAGPYYWSLAYARHFQKEYGYEDPHS